jgi:hypothetical protein
MLPITIESGTRVEWRAPGPQGAQGDPGYGTPAGGTTGKALVKASDADYDFGWAAPIPAPHAPSHATGGTDPLTPAAIGAEATGVAIPKALLDAKGDLIVASANDTPVRLPVGVAGTNPLLIPDTSASGGLKWGTWAEAGVARAGITTSAINVTWSQATPVLTLTATATVTLPAASANTAQLATIMNIGSGTVTINRSGSDLIAGSLTTTSIPGRGTLRLISDGTGWRVIDGSYDTDTVGLASYEWRRSGTPEWRLIAYDTGTRSVLADLNTVTGLVPAAATIRRTLYDVRLSLSASATADVSNGNIYTLPTGFIPKLVAPTAFSYRGLIGAEAWMMRPVGSGTWLVSLATTASTTTLWVTYETAATLPTSLPGTQVTAPV